MRAFFASLGISAAAYRAWRDGRWWGFLAPAIDLVLGKNHCYQAHINKVNRSR